MTWLIILLAYPVELFFLIESTVRLTYHGFGLKNAFRYSLNR